MCLNSTVIFVGCGHKKKRFEPCIDYIVARNKFRFRRLSCVFGVAECPHNNPRIRRRDAAKCLECRGDEQLRQWEQNIKRKTERDIAIAEQHRQRQMATSEANIHDEQQQQTQRHLQPLQQQEQQQQRPRAHPPISAANHRAVASIRAHQQRLYTPTATREPGAVRMLRHHPGSINDRVKMHPDGFRRSVLNWKPLPIVPTMSSGNLNNQPKLKREQSSTGLGRLGMSLSEYLDDVELMWLRAGKQRSPKKKQKGSK